MRAVGSGATAPSFPHARRSNPSRVGWFPVCFVLLCISLCGSGVVVYIRSRACAVAISKVESSLAETRVELDDARRRLLTTADQLRSLEEVNQRLQREVVTAQRAALIQPIDNSVPPPRQAPVAPHDERTLEDAHGQLPGDGNDAHGRQLEPAPRNTAAARALLIICYNRPDYLRRTLQKVHDNMPLSNRPHVYISQDGDMTAVSDVINDFKARFSRSHADVPVTHLRHPAVTVNAAGWAVGYYKLAQHFGWALHKLFNELKHRFVIVLEDDLDIAPDFFDYFTAMEQVLLNDDTLLAASAWNDIGQPQFVRDARRVHRSDFFPGLGWMLSRHVWEELGPKWPDSFWDDWLREPAQRKGRAFLRPEVSRTYTFGEQGTSASQFFDAYLANIKLNDERVTWAHEDVSYLFKAAYDVQFRDAVRKAREVPHGGIVSAACAEDEGVRALYTGLDGGSGFKALAREFGFIDDEKAGVPRTAYMGVVTLRHAGCTKYLVASDSGML